MKIVIKIRNIKQGYELFVNLCGALIEVDGKIERIEDLVLSSKELRLESYGSTII